VYHRAFVESPERLWDWILRAVGYGDDGTVLQSGELGARNLINDSGQSCPYGIAIGLESRTSDLKDRIESSRSKAPRTCEFDFEVSPNGPKHDATTRVDGCRYRPTLGRAVAMQESTYSRGRWSPD
jgi:hypothetical protein